MFVGSARLLASAIPQLDVFASGGLVFGMIPPANPAQQIALRYLEAWLAQVGNAPSLYVDAFASSDGLHCMHLLPSHSSAVLVQEDPAVAAQLRAALPGHANVQVLEASFAKAADLLATRAATFPNALVWLNAPAATQLPLQAVRRLACVPSADLWVRMPHEDLEKLATFRAMPIADLPPYARRMVEGYGRFFDEPGAGWLADWRRVEAEYRSRTGASWIAERFLNRLGGAGEARAIKTIELQLADGAHLYLAGLARDPLRLLAMNKAVEAAGLDDFVRWPHRRFRRQPPKPLAETLELFAAKVAPPAVTKELDEAALAEWIAARFLGQRVSWGEVLRSLLDSDVHPRDPARALRVLRRTGRAVFRSLRDLHAEVAFPDPPAPRKVPRTQPAPLFSAAP